MTYTEDSHGMKRVEITCSQCGPTSARLPDGPTETNPAPLRQQPEPGFRARRLSHQRRSLGGAAFISPSGRAMPAAGGCR